MGYKEDSIYNDMYDEWKEGKSIVGEDYDHLLRTCAHCSKDFHIDEQGVHYAELDFCSDACKDAYSLAMK